MNASRNQNELLDLLDALCSGTIAPPEHERLQGLLAADPAARRVYFDYLDLHLQLGQWQKAEAAVLERNEGREIGDLGISGFGDLPQDVAGAHPSSFIPLPSTVSPSFVGGPVFSYMVATIVLGLMLLGAWAYTITHDQRGSYVQQNSRGQTAPGGAADKTPDLLFVGRVTGMKDCRWSDPDTITYAGASVSLGRRYALSAGLMEITYGSGAKAILEGPCSYEVDSDAGGFLSLGKLTALVEKRGRVGDGETGRKPRSPILPSSSSPRLFSVRTPTAVVTDLGTEFGVEVGEEGNTTSYVFRGSVRVEAGDEESMVLRESESVRVEKVGRVRETHHETGSQAARKSVRFTHPATPPRFVRAIPQPRRGFIDLTDIVAGGDGFGQAGQRGIDAVTGRAMAAPARKFHVQGDHAFHRVDENPLVDGVFVPDGGHGPVQLDSAGHRTSVLIDTDNSTWNYLWSGQIPGDEDRPIPLPPVSCWLKNVNYAGRGHSVLTIPSNKGITFDLEAIRRANPDARIVRFTSVAGNTEYRSESRWASRVSADFWVFVDGELRFSKTDVNSTDGAFSIDLPLADSDRFLTLVVTDAGNGTNFDWTIFGDPRLEMKPESTTSRVRETHQDSGNEASRVSETHQNSVNEASRVRETHQESSTETPSSHHANRKEGPPMQQ